MAQQTIKYYLLLTALQKSSMSFIAAVYATFLLSHGLDYLQVNLVNLVFFSVLFLMEIPTGLYADVFGRKASFVASCFIFAAGKFIYSGSMNFWGFALAESVAAIGMTFQSGAFQAWLVDQLKHHGYESGIGHVIAREHQISEAAMIIGALAGAFLATINPSYPWIAGGVMFLVTGALAQATMREDYFVREKKTASERWQEMKDTARAGITYAFRNKTVKYIFALDALQFLAVMAPNMQWQPMFGKLTPGYTGLGAIWVGMSVFMIAGAFLARPLVKRWKSEKYALCFSQIIIGLGVAGTALSSFLPLMLLPFLIHELGRGLYRPLRDAYLNENIPSAQRATIISLDSIVHHIAGAMGLIGSGLAAKYWGLKSTWLIFGCLLIIGTLLLAKNGKKIAD